MKLYDVIALNNAPQSTQMFNQMGMTRAGSNSPGGNKSVWHSSKPLTPDLHQQYEQHLKQNQFKPVNTTREGDSYHQHPDGSTATIHPRSYNGSGAGHYITLTHKGKMQ